MSEPDAPESAPKPPTGPLEAIVDSTTLPPFFHPTRVCFVDDNQAFLNSVHGSLDSTLPQIGFTQPTRALAHFTSLQQLPLIDRCVAGSGTADGDASLELRLDLIEQEINQAQRFDQLSVLMIDYAMPQLSGLELCDQVRLPYVQKVMITGVADEIIAVEAFNDGLIHHFVRKHSLTEPELVARLVRQLQLRFFHAQAGPLLSALGEAAPQFLKIPAVVREIITGMVNRDLIEYYFCTSPPGLLLLDQDGRHTRLLVLNEAARAAQLELALAHRAPPPVIAALRGGESLLNLWDHPSEYPPGSDYPWTQRLQPATVIIDRERFSLAWIDDVAPDIDFDPTQSTFRAFMAQQPIPKAIEEGVD